MENDTTLEEMCKQINNAFGNIAEIHGNSISTGKIEIKQGNVADDYGDYTYDVINHYQEDEHICLQYYDVVTLVIEILVSNNVPVKVSDRTILKAVDFYQGKIGEYVVEFSETGYKVISDTRQWSGGYLHICEESAAAITEACRDQIVKYMFKHESGLPGLGATPQHRYFKGLTTEDVEKIGNDGKKAYYNY